MIISSSHRTVVIEGKFSTYSHITPATMEGKPEFRLDPDARLLDQNKKIDHGKMFIWPVCAI